MHKQDSIDNACPAIRDGDRRSLEDFGEAKRRVMPYPAERIPAAAPDKAIEDKKKEKVRSHGRFNARILTGLFFHF